jgi:hypothetical protein
MKKEDVYTTLANQRFTKQSRASEIQTILKAYEELDKTSDKWETSETAKTFEKDYGVKIEEVAGLYQE